MLRKSLEIIDFHNMDDLVRHLFPDISIKSSNISINIKKSAEAWAPALFVILL